MKQIWWQRRYGRAPRPYVAFAATSKKQAERLYRAQNLIWVWLGLASILSAATYFARPSLGMILTSNSEPIDIMRELLFAFGGLFIAIGVWTIRRSIEIIGHVYFSIGAIINGIVVITIKSPTITFGSHVVSAITILGIAIVSGFRAYFIIKWIGAQDHASNSSE